MTHKAYVHIGLAKTGTTSLQQHLANSRRRLKSAGFYYPEHGGINKTGGHHCLAWKLSNTTQRRELCEDFSLELFQQEIERAQQYDIIISSEELSSLSFSYVNIRRLLGLFPKHQVHVVAYVREQAEFFNSLYQEIVSDFQDPGPMAGFVQARLEEPRYDYACWFGIWNDLTDKRLIVRPFDRTTLKGSDVIEDFVIALKLPTSLLKGRTELQNIALNNIQTAAVLELIRRANDHTKGEPMPFPTRRRFKQISLNLCNAPELSRGERFWGISTEDTQTIRARYAASNTEFFALHGFDNFVYDSTSERPAVTAVEFNDLEKTARDCVDRVWTQTFLPIIR